MKKLKTVKKSTKVKKQVEPSQDTPTVVEKRPSKYPYPSYDDAAWQWMLGHSEGGSIPGAFAPITYIGTLISRRISLLLGRSITLDEAMWLVRADGPPANCTFTNVEFQPVEYVAVFSDVLAEKIKAGIAAQTSEKPFFLTQLQLRYGGAYYLDPEIRKMTQYSGSVYKFFKGRYVPDEDESPLVRIALETAKTNENGWKQWGRPLSEVTAEAVRYIERTNARTAGDALLAEQARRVSIGNRRNIGNLGEMWSEVIKDPRLKLGDLEILSAPETRQKKHQRNKRNGRPYHHAEDAE